MTELRQAATLALDALELSAVTVDSFGVQKATQAAIAALRIALEQQAEPPPEWPLIKNILAVFGLDAISFVAKWQAAQQQAEPLPVQKPLTHDEIEAIGDKVANEQLVGPVANFRVRFTRAIEAAHRIKDSHD